MSDNVNHPSHYKKEGKKECIDEMVEQFGIENTIVFALLNSYKYIYRDGLKSIALDDQQKAEWYLNWAKNKIIEYNLQDTIYETYYEYVLKIYSNAYS